MMLSGRQQHILRDLSNERGVVGALLAGLGL